jgi:hypothetical protein
MAGAMGWRKTASKSIVAPVALGLRRNGISTEHCGFVGEPARHLTLVWKLRAEPNWSRLCHNRAYTSGMFTRTIAAHCTR